MRVFRVIQKIEEWMLSAGILTIAGLTIINVLSRSILGISLASAEELSQFAIVFVTFIGLSYAASQGRHIRMTAIYDQLPVKIRKILMVLITGGTAFLMFLLAYYSMRYIGTVRALGTVSPALQMPLYIVYLAAPLGLTLAGIQYSMAAYRNLTSSEVYLSYDKLDEFDEPMEDGI